MGCETPYIGRFTSHVRKCRVCGAVRFIARLPGEGGSQQLTQSPVAPIRAIVANITANPRAGHGPRLAVTPPPGARRSDPVAECPIAGGDHGGVVEPRATRDAELPERVPGELRSRPVRVAAGSHPSAAIAPPSASPSRRRARRAPRPPRRARGPRSGSRRSRGSSDPPSGPTSTLSGCRSAWLTPIVAGRADPEHDQPRRARSGSGASRSGARRPIG